MKMWMKRILSVTLCAIMALTVVFVNTKTTKAEDGGKIDLSVDATYTVPVALLNSTGSSASMAAAAIDQTAAIQVKDGQATIILTFGTIELYGLYGNLTTLEYLPEVKWENSSLVTSNAQPGTIYSYRSGVSGYLTDPVQEEQLIETAGFVLPYTNSSDIYIFATVDAMEIFLGAQYARQLCMLRIDYDNLTLDLTELNESITAAETALAELDKDNYTEESVKALEDAITAAKTVQTSGTAAAQEVNAAIAAIEAALTDLQLLAKTYDLADGIYETTAEIANQERYAGTIKSASLRIEGGVTEVTLEMQKNSSGMYIYGLEIKEADGSYTTPATVVDEEDEQIVYEYKFTLPENVEYTDIKVGYYVPGVHAMGGFERQLYIDLENAQFVSELPVEEEKLEDGTYSIDAQFLNVSTGAASMANGALTGAYLVVEDGAIELLLDMKDMSGVYVYKLQYEAGEEYKEAAIVKTDAEGNAVRYAMPVAQGVDTINSIVTYDPYPGTTHDQAVLLALDWNSVAETKLDDDNEDEKGTEKPLDKDELEDGVYEVKVALWNASQDQPSMGAYGLLGTDAEKEQVWSTARIAVEDGEYTMYVYTQEMTFGAVTARLQYLRAENAEGGYTQAAAVGTEGQNPTGFYFGMPHTEEYIKVQMNPMVSFMGNTYLDAKLKVDYSTLTAANEIDPVVPPVTETGSGSGSGTTTTTPNATSNVKTGDNNQAIVFFAAMILALAAAAYVGKRYITGKVAK